MPLNPLLTAIITTPIAGTLGTWIGFTLGRRTRPAPAPYQCGCGHPLAMHSQDRCHDNRVQKGIYDKRGNYIGTQLSPCECRRYIGDFPVDQVDWSRIQLPTPEVPRG